ncbi:MAG: redox-regulated ATPase YchF [Candidatus Zixiibacteriota bacterium]|nr:MAG: redox-regulated ATPase YchF [candidate division Zixibacteria bacterium]
MKLGIIGKPQSGKTTVFNAASGHQESVGDYSQAVHRAVIRVPDERVDTLARLLSPQKVVYAEIEFLDAPGFTGKGKDASAPEISPDLKLMDALVPVLDCFSPNPNPAKDVRDLLDEMILADQVIVESNIEKKSRKIKLTGDKAGAKELELLESCRAALDDGKLLIDLDFREDQDKILRGYTFLTRKPLLLVMNIAENDIEKGDLCIEQIARFIVPGECDAAVLFGKMEMELLALEPGDREIFMKDLGISSPAVVKVIRKSYSLLGLISFITVAGPEVRAWTIRNGTVAQKAAGTVHTDMERGFIRAEVIKYDDFVKYETLAAIKAAGKAHLEGKDYIVQDGDVIQFRFNI